VTELSRSDIVVAHGEALSRKRLMLRATLWSAPGILWLLLFLAIPSLLLLALAFATRGSYGEILWEPTLKNFRKLAGFGVFGWSADYLWIVARTIWIATVTTVACVVLAYPIALFVANRSRSGRALWLAVLMIPFCTNIVVRAYGWQLILPQAIYPGAIAVYIGMISTNLSFAVLPIYTSVERLDWTIPEAVRDLYGSRWAVFRHGILPQTRPGLIVAAIITFIPALGMFVVSDLLGGGRYDLLGNAIQRQFGASRDFPFGAALSFTLIVATLLALRSYGKAEGTADERG
jgi:spermidine/putrescine transport system permease protein